MVSSERDWWPLIRLLTVGLAFVLWAHFKFGWTLHLRDAWTIPAGIALIFSFLVMLSTGLAHIVLVVLMFPLCGIILCNDWFYDAACWTLSRLADIRSPRILAAFGLLGEIVLFGGVAWVLSLARL